MKLKDKLIQIIKILGIGLNEIIIDIELDTITVNSIEWHPSDDKIYLHIFNDDLDIELDFDDASEENQIIIFKKLSQIAYN